MTANEDTLNDPASLAEGNETENGGHAAEQSEAPPSEPMPLSQKICLSVTAGFLLCSIAVVFNVPAILLSILSFFFVEYWIATTIIMAIAAAFAG